MPDQLMDRLRRADPLGNDRHPAVPPLESLALDLTVAEESASPSRGRRRWRATGLSVLIALLVGTGTAAASLTALTGDPLGRTPSLSVEPTAASVRITAARSADPDGGPDWAVRLGRAERGLACVGVGQVEGGQLGLVGLDGVFRPNRPSGADDCAVPPLPGGVLAQARTFLGDTKQTAVSVVYGVAGRDVDQLTLHYPGGRTRPVQLDADRVFVVAQRGSLSATSPHLVGATDAADANGHYLRLVEVDFGRRWAANGQPGAARRPETDAEHRARLRGDLPAQQEPTP